MPYAFVVTSQEAEIVRDLYEIEEPRACIKGSLFNIDGRFARNFIARLWDYSNEKGMTPGTPEHNSVTRLAERVARVIGKRLLDMPIGKSLLDNPVANEDPPPVPIETVHQSEQSVSSQTEIRNRKRRRRRRRSVPPVAQV